MNFRSELTNLINKCNMEKGSDTPDYILSEYIENMLMAFDIAVNNRERVYGRKEDYIKTKINKNDLHMGKR